MKKRLLIMVLSFLSLPVLSQNLISSFLEGIDRDVKRGTMQVNMSGKILSLAAKNDPTIDADMKKALENIDKISMISGLSVDDKQRKQLDKLLLPYEELMSIEEEGQRVMMYTREEKKQIVEFVLCVCSDKELILMSITGKIDLKQISKLSKSIKVEGVEHLDKMNHNKNKQK